MHENRAVNTKMFGVAVAKFEKGACVSFLALALPRRNYREMLCNDATADLALTLRWLQVCMLYGPYREMEDATR